MGHRCRDVGTALLALWLMGCHTSEPAAQVSDPVDEESTQGEPNRGGLVVVAPHPDDETLIASGAILAAREQGELVTVVVLTNGDFDCRHDGLTREAESVRGLDVLDVDEQRVIFLGYPDGSLSRLGREPLTTKRLRAGICAQGNTTYGGRGREHVDFHTERFGRPALYTDEALVDDLAQLLDEVRPERVIVTHAEDTHPDHASAYLYLRRALDRVDEAPVIWSQLVHNGDCWPTGESSAEPCPPGGVHARERTPDLTGRLDGLRAELRLEVPDSCQDPNPTKNPKIRAILAHHSQTHGDLQNYLVSFARRDEMFFVERLGWQDGRWLPLPNEPFVDVAEDERAIEVERFPARADVHLDEDDEDESFRSIELRVRPTAGAPLRRYVLEREDESLVLQRVEPLAPAREARRFVLPHDAPMDLLLDVEMRVIQRDPLALETTVRLGERPLGVAIDVVQPGTAVVGGGK